LEYSVPGVIEALSFKLSLDFVKYLKKNRIVLNDIRLDFFDRESHEFIGFDNQEMMEYKYNESYLPLEKCDVGRVVSIQTFTAQSNTYNFDTSYKAIDVNSLSYKLTPLSSFDIQRNSNRKIFKDRQINFINNTVAEYVKFYNEIKYIYDTGIYSPCYAEPGWTENTWWLKSLREAVIQDNTNRSKFPYRNSIINRRPPK